jgi:hypothetical protein
MIARTHRSEISGASFIKADCNQALFNPAQKLPFPAGFPAVYIFRPAYIYPVQARREPTFSYRVLRAIYLVFRLLFPNQVIRADDLARTMVDAAVRDVGVERQAIVFENATFARLLPRDP